MGSVCRCVDVELKKSDLVTTNGTIKEIDRGLIACMVVTA